jgi:pimeloyl-ACP methyl ester carboxylesterase
VPALVLIHGFAGCAGSWDELVGHLDRERYRPLALELPGHGGAAGLEPTGYEQAAIRSAPVSRSRRRWARPIALRA